MTLITTAHMGIVTTTTQNLAEVGSALVEDRDEKEDAAQAWRAAVAVAQQNEVWLDALTRNQAPTEWQAWVKQLIELDSRIKAAETARHRAADTAVAAAIDQKAAAVADHALIGVVAGEWYQ